MLDEYQLLAREQLICGAQVHVGVTDRDLAVAVARRVRRGCRCCSRCRPARRTGWARTAATRASGPWSGSAGPPPVTRGEVTTAAEHEALVADLISSGTITDPGMIYFDVRPSAHVPTVELRVTDACPDVETIVLLAGLFRALVRREVDAPARRRGAHCRTAAGAARRRVAGRPLRAGGRPGRPAPVGPAGAGRRGGPPRW